MHWVLVRGVKQDQRHWRGFPARLAARTGGEVTTLDLPGTGAAFDRPAPWTVEGLADDLARRWEAERPDAGPWGLCGLSLGGMVALAWAARRPPGLATLVVGNSSAGDLARPWQRFTPATWRALPRLVTRRDPARREREVLQLTTSALADAERDRVAADFAALHAERPFRRSVLVRQLVAGAGFRAPRRVDVPVRVLVGARDRLVDPACSAALARRLGAPLHTHPDAGHDLGLDAPDWLAEQLATAARELGDHDQVSAPSGRK